jgi:hypothetical protein
MPRGPSGDLGHPSGLSGKVSRPGLPVSYLTGILNHTIATNKPSKFNVGLCNRRSFYRMETAKYKIANARDVHTIRFTVEAVRVFKRNP